MTGFAHASESDDDSVWTWEVRSVNGKNLDLRFRLPVGFDGLEPAVRGAVSARIRRGSVTANLRIDRVTPRGRFQVNEDLLEQLIELRHRFVGVVRDEPLSLEALLGVRGLVDIVDEEPDEAEKLARDARITTTLETVLDALVAVRSEEGERMGSLLRDRLDEIAGLTEKAEASAALQPEAIKERLDRLMRELLESDTGLPEERLAQEAALLVSKADVREELDRLKAHVTASRNLIDSGGPVGRRLDFLCQELTREANTLCAKSADVALTRIGLELKASVEQLREQVQNLE